MTTAPILQSAFDHNGQSVAYSVFDNSSAKAPNQTFIGHTCYRNRHFVIFSDDKDDCHLGLRVLMQHYDARVLTAGTETGSTVH